MSRRCQDPSHAPPLGGLKCKVTGSWHMYYLMVHKDVSLRAYLRSTSKGRFFFSAGVGFVVNSDTVVIPSNYRYVPMADLRPRRTPPDPGRSGLR